MKTANFFYRPAAFSLLLTVLLSGFVNTQAQTKTTSAGSSPDIYIAGYKINSNQKAVALYLKNGVPVPLSNGQNDASANAIAVVGNNVYVAGMNKGQAVYWKNGQEIQLTTGSRIYGDTYAIAVKGEDVYVAGYERVYDPQGSFKDFAAYWKNGQAFFLTDGKDYATAHGIAIAGNGDVYILGTQLGKPRYWKNGQPLDAIGASFHTVSDIAIYNNEVFLAGTFDYQAVYWKGGRGMTTVSEKNKQVKGASIAVSGSDVYIAGVENGVATYWKNQKATRLARNIDYPQPYAIAVYDNDVYVAGLGETGSAYWKNGREVVLNTLLSQSKDILIVKGNNEDKIKADQPVKKENQNVTVTLTPKEAGEKFLAENKNKPGVITTPSGLQYTVLKSGQGNKPVEGDKVTISYRGSFINGEEFTKTANPVKVPLNELLPGFFDGLLLMTTGSKYKFFMHPKFAFGNVPTAKVPAGSTVIFEIELLGVSK